MRQPLKKRKQIKRFDPEKASVFSNLLVIPHKALTRLKCTLPIKSVPRVFGEVASSKKYHQYVFGSPFPRNISDLGSNTLHGSKGIRRELLWAALKVSFFAEEINKFIKLEGQYQAALLSAEFSKAVEILGEIEQSFGLSLWSIENRLVLFQLSDGIEAQKHYAQTIAETEKVDSLLNLFVSHFSGRIEPGVSFDGWKSTVLQYENDFEQQKIQRGFIDYFKFKLDFWGSFSADLDYVAILRFEASWPIIDQYLMLVRVLMSLSAKAEATAELQQSISGCLKTLKHIRSPYLANLWRLHFWEIYPGMTIDLDTNRLLDIYTKGDYEEVIRYCEDNVPFNLDQLQILVKARCHVGLFKPARQDRIADKLASWLADIYLKNPNTYNSAQQVLKLILDLSAHLWVSPIFDVVRYEYNPLAAQPSFHLFAQLCSTPETPKQHYALREERKKCFTHARDEALPKQPEGMCSLTHSFFASLDRLHKNGDDDGGDFHNLPVARPRRIKYRALFDEVNNRWPQAEARYEILLESKDVLDVQDGIEGLARCYQQSGKINDCLSLVVSRCLENEYLRVKFNLSNLRSYVIQKDVWSVAKKSLMLPILLDFIVKWDDKDAANFRVFAFEDFLESYSIGKPSELRELWETFPYDQVVYFLENICVLDTMEGYPHLNSSEEAKKERIAICQLLTELNPAKSSAYTDEIRQITQELVLRKHVREIDESRIFVDTDGIKRFLEKGIRESFSRHKTLLATRPGPPSYKYINISRDGVDFHTPSDDRTHSFLSMFFAVRDQFVLSPEFGLDSYLSVRIRHGTLAGQIRRPLTLAELITQKDGVSGKYQDNSVWGKKYGFLPPRDLKALMGALADFSRKVDALTEELKGSLIQIRTEKKQTAGLFDFRPYVGEIEELQAKITIETTYDEFLQLLFDYCWFRTEKSLSDIRKYLRGELKAEFNRAFSELRQSVLNVLGEQEVADLLGQIANAQTALQYELDHIAEWFRKAQSLGINDYPIDLAVQVALALIENTNPRHKLRPVTENTAVNLVLKRTTLSALVNILYILLDNSIVHSYQNSPKVEIRIFFREPWLILELENSVDSRLSGTEKGVDEKNEQLKHHLEKLPMEAVVREGGTGFYKIGKIIQVDLQSSYMLKAVYQRKDWFGVTLEIHAMEMLCNGDTNR
jgi:hypothetical protein